MRFMPFVLAAVVSAVSLPAQEQAVCSSPDKQVQVLVRTAKQRTAPAALVYEVRYRGNPIIAESILGIDPLNQAPLGPDVKIVKATPSSGRETYTLGHGKRSAVDHAFNALVIEAQENGGLGRKLEVEFRAFDDGVAFRYRLPLQAAIRELQIEKELTQFRIAREGSSWPLILNGFRTSYEDNYVELPPSAIKRESLVALPFTFEVPSSGWASITEAHLENFAGMYLTRTGEGSLGFEAKLAPRADRPEVAVVRDTPVATPWRVIQVAPSAARLMDSPIVLSLNPPSRIRTRRGSSPGRPRGPGGPATWRRTSTSSPA
jgi:alpha-glucosidase